MSKAVTAAEAAAFISNGATVVPRSFQSPIALECISVKPFGSPVSLNTGGSCI